MENIATKYGVCCYWKQNVKFNMEKFDQYGPKMIRENDDDEEMIIYMGTTIEKGDNGSKGEVISGESSSETTNNDEATDGEFKLFRH